MWPLAVAAAAAAIVTAAEPADAVSTTLPDPVATGSLNVSTGSLNVSTSVDDSATSTAPCAGTVDTSTGAESSSVVNAYVPAVSPANALRAALASVTTPAAITTVYDAVLRPVDSHPAGCSVTVVPLTVTCVASLTASVLLTPPAVDCSTTTPLPASTASLNVSTIAVPTATDAAPLAGAYDATAGAVESASTNVYALPARPAHALPAASVSAPAATVTV